MPALTRYEQLEQKATAAGCGLRKAHRSGRGTWVKYFYYVTSTEVLPNGQRVERLCLSLDQVAAAIKKG